MPEPKLRLYVWENVFRDYTPGVAFALATTAEHARRLIVARDFTRPELQREILSGVRSIYCDEIQPSIALELAREPDVYDEPCGYYLRGGG